MAKIQKITLKGQVYIEHGGFIRYHLSTTDDRKTVNAVIEIGQRVKLNRPVKPAQTIEIPIRSIPRLSSLMTILKKPGGNWKRATYLFQDSQLAGVLTLEQDVLWFRPGEYSVIPNGK